jgi:hypothetical protein
MDQPHYEFEYSLPRKVYSFTSEGRNGPVRKVVEFTLIQSGKYNLGFGDWNEEKQGYDDKAITDNGDMEIMLSTVIRVTTRFLSTIPGVSVHLTGSTAARIRLYRIIISNNYEVISREFTVLGLLCGEWFKYEKNVNYEAFLVSKLS